MNGQTFASIPRSDEDWFCTTQSINIWFSPNSLVTKIQSDIDDKQYNPKVQKTKTYH